MSRYSILINLSSAHSTQERGGHTANKKLSILAFVGSHSRSIGGSSGFWLLIRSRRFILTPGRYAVIVDVLVVIDMVDSMVVYLHKWARQLMS
jgi:hypothetical protein